MQRGGNEVHVFSRAAVSLNGITIAYVMGVVNALFACLLAFGVPLTDQEIAAVATFINASMVLAIHMGHRLGEATASGATGATSRVKMEAVGIAAQRRGLEIHDEAEALRPSTPPPGAEG